jgi:hypothetical protein
MALLDLHPVWVLPELDAKTGLALPIPPDAIEAALAGHPDAAAVYLTSPDYFGVLSDIKGAAAACRAAGVPLLCDNAHGAHLRFLPGDLHPVAQGAALCCDSLHKTLPALTGAALLHVGEERFLPQAKAAMALFGSTSPSFLILLSMDLLLPFLAGEARHALAGLCAAVSGLRELAASRGFLAPGFLAPAKGFDPIRLTLGFAPLGYRQSGFAQLLEAHKIMPEYLDSDFCVLLPGVSSSGEDFARVRAMLRSARLSPPRGVPAGRLILPGRACSARESFFSASVSGPVESSPGRVAAGIHIACPPGVPVVLPGEIISGEIAVRLKNSGISSVDVLQ